MGWGLVGPSVVRRRPCRPRALAAGVGSQGRRCQEGLREGHEGVQRGRQVRELQDVSVLSRQEGGGRASCLWDPVLLPSQWLGLSQHGQANVPSARHRDRSKKKKKKQEKQMKGKAEKKGAASRSSSSTKSSAKGLSESFKSKEFVSSDESSSAESKKEVGPCSGVGESPASLGCFVLPPDAPFLFPQDSEEEGGANSPPSSEDSASGSD